MICKQIYSNPLTIHVEQFIEMVTPISGAEDTSIASLKEEQDYF